MKREVFLHLRPELVRSRVGQVQECSGSDFLTRRPVRNCKIRMAQEVQWFLADAYDRMDEPVSNELFCFPTILRLSSAVPVRTVVLDAQTEPGLCFEEHVQVHPPIKGHCRILHAAAQHKCQNVEDGRL